MTAGRMRTLERRRTAGQMTTSERLLKAGQHLPPIRWKKGHTLLVFLNNLVLETQSFLWLIGSHNRLIFTREQMTIFTVTKMLYRYFTINNASHLTLFGALTVRTPSLESAVATRSMSAQAGKVNSL